LNGKFRAARQYRQEAADSEENMPVITVQLAAARPVDIKRRLVAGLTDIAAEVLDVPREGITVLIEELGRENWASGGELRVDRSAKQDAPRLDLEAFFRKPPAAKAPPAKPSKKAPAKSPRRR
jgi:4-oxalocrotonate tautomerase